MNALRNAHLTLAAIAALSVAACGGANRTEPQTPVSHASLTSADATTVSVNHEPATTTSAVYPMTITTGSALETAPPEKTAGTPSPVSAPTGSPAIQGAMNDAQIAGILEAALTGDLREAREASRRTRDSRVRDLAGRIAAEEGTAGADLTAYESRHSIAPQTTTTREQLKAEGARLLRSLESSRRAQFDSTYLDAQLAETSRFIQLLDDTLIPNAEDPELRAQLATVRSMLSTHLQLAREAQTGHRDRLDLRNASGTRSVR